VIVKKLNLLPGVPEAYVVERLSAAGGSELESGKFLSPYSSSALAVNAFAWFHPQPNQLPPIPGTEVANWPAIRVEVEYCARFPWKGGRHPWLDAFVETESTLIGIESKRHEPFRDRNKVVKLSEAYDRPVWGEGMASYEAMRDNLRTGKERFEHLDAVQLVKHAFGLITEAVRSKKMPMLVYLYAEPSKWDTALIQVHRQEVERFRGAVEGAAVRFVSVRWKDWLSLWASLPNETIAAHGRTLSAEFKVS
jgi:hypothetical protein